MFSPDEKAYLLEHFRARHNECKRSSRPGAADTAETWAKLHKLFVSATSPQRVTLPGEPV